MKKLLQAQALTKKYNNNEILSNVDLSVFRHQSIAFVGYNGSGKSTLLKILANLVRPTSGKVVYSHKLKFNYVPESFPALNFTAGSYIRHIGKIEGLDEKYLYHRRKELFSRFFMDDMAATPMKYLSKGTLQKVCVMQAMLTKPDILLLDEPLSGQDMDSQHEFISQVKELNNQGVTVLMACHEPYLIHRLAKTVYELSNGNLEEKTADSFQWKECCELVFVSPDPSLACPLFENKEVEIKQHAAGRLALTVPADQSNDTIIKTIQAGWTLKEIHHENDI